MEEAHIYKAEKYSTLAIKLGEPDALSSKLRATEFIGKSIYDLMKWHSQFLGKREPQSAYGIGKSS